MPTSPALQAAYNDGGQVIIRTVSFSASNLLGVPDFNFVHGFEPITLNSISYTPVDLGIQFSPRQAKLAQTMSFSVAVGEGNGSNFRNHLDTIAANQLDAVVTYREFLEGEDLPEAELTLKFLNASYKQPTLKLTASFDEIINALFPNRFYNAEEFAGLRFYGR